MVISARQAAPARTIPVVLRLGSREAFSPSAKPWLSHLPPPTALPSFQDLARVWGMVGDGETIKTRGSCEGEKGECCSSVEP